VFLFIYISNPFSDTVKILGEPTFDSSLTMGRLGPYIKEYPRLVSITYAPLSKFVHLWLILWPFLLLLLWSRRVLIMLIRPIYVLFGCPQKHVARLQRVQQALARVVTQQSSLSPLTSTKLLKQLHWHLLMANLI